MVYNSNNASVSVIVVCSCYDIHPNLHTSLSITITFVTICTTYQATMLYGNSYKLYIIKLPYLLFLFTYICTIYCYKSSKGLQLLCYVKKHIIGCSHLLKNFIIDNFISMFTTIFPPHLYL